MGRRSSSLITTDTALQRELNGKYSIVEKVADSIDSIEILATEDIAGLLVALNEAKDFTGISVVQGASTAWDPITKTITVATEKGDQGDSISIDFIVDNTDGTFTWNFSDGSSFTTSDLRGQKGVKGDKGDTGDALTLSSVVNNGDYTYTWLFSDGSSFTTGNLRGGTGEQGPAGPKGDVGGALTLDDIIYNNDGTFTWKFSDSTSYVTPNLKGDKGDDGAPGIRGLQGVSVHHSKPTNTTDPEGDFGTFGELDTYTLYGDAAETIVLGSYIVRNGENAYTRAVSFGYTGTEAEFYNLLVNVEQAAEDISTAIAKGEEAENSAAAALVSETNAKASEDASAISEANAQASATSANSSRIAVEAVFDNFDDRYLGSKDTDPVVDNDGDPLVAGQVYWNSVSEGLRFYNGAAWEEPTQQAATSATNALASENAAKASELAAASSEANAALSENNAHNSELSALDAAAQAVTASSLASTSESNAAASELAASTSEANASTSEINALASENAAALSETNSATSETNAANSAISSAASASDSATSASESATSAANALLSEQSATSSASSATASAASALVSETNAATSESNAAASEANAALSASQSATSASDAATSASNAATSETNAATSEASAATSAIEASTSEANTQATLETLYGIFLGVQASDPTVDLNGNPLDGGEWYYNSNTDVTRVYVAGSGWVNSAVDTSSFILANSDTSLSSLTLNGGTGEQGKLTWNVDEETVDLIQNGSTLQLGQEVHYHVRNNTGSTIANGTPVYATGTLGNSGRITVAPFIADGSIPESFFLGITTEEIPNDTDGKVTYFGKVLGVDTSAFSEGDVLYASPVTAGSLTSTHPTGSEVALPVAFVISSASNGTLFVRSTNLNDNKYVTVDSLQTALDSVTGTLEEKEGNRLALINTLDNPNAYSTSADDFFGSSVAASGNYVIIGAPSEDDAGGIDSGKAYIYNVTTGTLLHTLDNPNAYDTSGGDNFGQSVAISGDYAVVSAPGEQDAGGVYSGKAYIFDVTTGLLLHTLDNPNVYSVSEEDLFGYSVGVSGNYAVVSAPGEQDAGGVYSGKVYVFDAITGLLLRTLNNPNAYDISEDDLFGLSVAVSGSYVIVAAPSEDDAGGIDSGKVYIFDVTTGALLHTLDNPNTYGTSAYDNFGNLVSISGNYAIVGTPKEDDADGEGSGKAYIFNVVTGALVHTLDNPNAYSISANDRFGRSVAISDKYAVVSAPTEDDAGGTDSGKVYIFDVTTGALLHTLDNPNGYGTSEDDNFAFPIAISGNYIIVGTPVEDDADGKGSGKAYIFKVIPDYTLAGNLTVDGSINGTYINEPNYPLGWTGKPTIDSVFIGPSAGESCFSADASKTDKNAYIYPAEGNIAIGRNAIKGLGPVDFGYGSTGGSTYTMSTIAIGDNAGANAVFYDTAYDTLPDPSILIGKEAGAGSTELDRAVFIGYEAGLFSAGYETVGIGHRAGKFSTGNSCTFIGNQSGESATSGSGNAFLGHQSGNFITSGSYNVCVGIGSGTYITTGESNIFIGASANVDSFASGDAFNRIVIGDNATGLTDSTVTLGNSSITALRCQATSITGLSDARDKTNVLPIAENGLKLIDSINPVTFDWNQRDGERVGILDAGFLAQELLEAQQTSGVHVEGLVDETDPERLEAAYGKLLPYAIAAIKELSDKVKELETKLETLNG